MNSLMRALALVPCLLIAPLTAAVRSANEETVPDGHPANVLTEVYNRFGLGLFSQIARSDSGKNVFISPASAAFALAMLYNGTGGTTRTEMTAALGLGGLPLEELNEANSSLLNSLGKGDSNVELAVANSIWYRNTFQFRQDFLARTRQSYSAEVSALDFDDPGAPGIINEWVKQGTRDKISKMIDQISPDDVMFLMNAVYFKGKWTYPFSRELTSDRDFHRLDGATTQIPMMQQTRELEYFATEAFQAVRLPYGKGSCSMLLFLPAGDYGLQTLVTAITPERLAEWQTQFRSQDLHLMMPRFTLKYEIFLNDPLTALGMKSAFDPELADLSGLWDRPAAGSFNLFVSYVRQKTFVEVNEEGTEAAAVTDIGIKATSVPPPPIEMIVDRPFICAIVDDHSGLILFMGAIIDPAKADSPD